MGCHCFLIFGDDRLSIASVLQTLKRPPRAFVLSIGLHLALLAVLMISVSSGSGYTGPTGYGEDAIEIGLVGAPTIAQPVQSISSNAPHAEETGTESRSVEQPTKAAPAGETGPTRESAETPVSDDSGQVEAPPHPGGRAGGREQAGHP